MVISTLFGYEMAIARPKGYDPNPEVLKFASERGNNIFFTESVEEAFKDVDVVYANTWHCMAA